MSTTVRMPDKVVAFLLALLLTGFALIAAFALALEERLTALEQRATPPRNPQLP